MGKPSRSRQAKMALVNSPWSAILVLAGFCLAACTQSPAGAPKSVKQVRRIILHSRHWGAHGMGYNTESQNKLSQKLTPADVPALMSLMANIDLRVGAQYALSSQCEAAILPVREAVMQHKMDFLDAEYVMQMIEEFSVCTPETRQRASAMRSEIESLRKAEYLRVEQEQKQILAEDARIQRNALKMMDPKQAKELTRQEREEVYKRSLKEMGLKEDGPLTPAQKDLIQRMYRTMVLGESGTTPPN
ncbi:MAG TPA: hypothetical protein VFK06_12865 [Candidatus Angelobacter sp.]|nr:hypothetical protein [Candidatus Angelobacter sp.]